jgi:flagellar assembly protein FliH
MDTLIRSAQLAPFRTRLSELRAGRSDTRTGTGSSDVSGGELQPARPALDSLRDEIERQVRAESAVQIQEIYESERKRAHVEGYADGVAAGKAAAATELAQACERLTVQANRALSALAEAHRAALAKLESSVGEVTFAALCRLVSAQVASRSFVVGIVEHTCAALRADLNATVRLHPRDIETLREWLQDEELRVDSLGLKMIPDESLILGGCVIEAPSGRYDGGIENQLRRLHAVLTGSAKE